MNVQQAYLYNMRIKNHDDSNLYIVQLRRICGARPSVVTVSSFGRQKLIENMMRVSVYAFKQIIVSFLKEFCYSWGFRTTVTKFLAVANKCIKPSKRSNVSSRAEARPGRRTVQHL